jgi:hypothetical protein
VITALALAGASASIAGTRAAASPRVKYVIDVFQGQLVQPMLSYRAYVNDRRPGLWSRRRDREPCLHRLPPHRI